MLIISEVDGKIRDTKVDFFSVTDKTVAAFRTVAFSNLVPNQPLKIANDQIQLNLLQGDPDSFSNSSMQNMGNLGQIRMPSMLSVLNQQNIPTGCGNSSFTIEGFGVDGTNPGKSDKKDYQDSTTIGLSYFNGCQQELNMTNLQEKFVFVLPRNTGLKRRGFKTLEMPKNWNREQNFLALTSFPLSKSNNALHLNIRPTVFRSEVGYFFAIKLNSSAVLNRTVRDYNFYRLFCPSGETHC